jgi:integrase-like protein
VFHDLRHTFGTIAVRIRRVPEVQGYMGHADIKTTMGYVHHVPRYSAAKEMTKAVRQIAGLPDVPGTRSVPGASLVKVTANGNPHG